MGRCGWRVGGWRRIRCRRGLWSICGRLSWFYELIGLKLLSWSLRRLLILRIFQLVVCLLHLGLAIILVVVDSSKIIGKRLQIAGICSLLHLGTLGGVSVLSWILSRLALLRVIRGVPILSFLGRRASHLILGGRVGRFCWPGMICSPLVWHLSGLSARQIYLLSSHRGSWCVDGGNRSRVRLVVLCGMLAGCYVGSDGSGSHLRKRSS